MVSLLKNVLNNYQNTPDGQKQDSNVLNHQDWISTLIHHPVRMVIIKNLEPTDAGEDMEK